MSNYRKTMADALREMYPLDEGTIDKVKEIASKKQAMKIDGVMVDSFTASAISQIYDRVNDANKKKMDSLPITKLANLAFKMMQKNEFVPEEADLDEDSLDDFQDFARLYGGGDEIYVVTQGKDSNSLKVIGIEKDPNKAKKIRDRAKGARASLWGQMKSSQKVLKLKIGDPVSFEDSKNKLSFIEEVDLDEAKYTYKAATFNGNTVVGTGSTEEDAIKDAKNKAKELGSTLRKRISMKKEDVDLDEATKQVLAHGGKGKYKVTKDGDKIEIKFGGKVVGTADFDRGADSFFVSIKGEKGQKSFDDAQAIADYFAKNKITEGNDLDEGKQKPYVSSDSDGKHVMGASGKIVKSFKDMDSANAYLKKNYNELMKESDLDEGKMSQLHQYMQDKKSPEEIAKLMKLDVKTIKSLMSSHHPEDVEEASAYADARRSMSKDKDFSRKDSADDDTDASDDDIKGASKNIIMQMRKAQSLGVGGDPKREFKVEFGDGKKVQIPVKMAIAVQQKYNAMKKPADKEKFQARIGKSYKDMLSALKEELQPKKESILERMNRKIKENKHG
jgi:hypothetical protein